MGVSRAPEAHRVRSGEEKGRAQMDWLIAIVEGVVAALCASAISLLGLQLLRPRLRIVPFVAVHYSQELESLRYSFKVVNQSWRRLIDPRLELVVVYLNADGVEKNSLVERDRTDPMSISGRRKAKESSADNGIYAAAYGDLSEILAQRVQGGAHRARLRFRIYAKDEITGLGRLFEHTFDDLGGQVVYGRFAKGDTDTVVAKEPHPAWLGAVESFRSDSADGPGSQENVVPAARRSGGQSADNEGKH